LKSLLIFLSLLFAQLSIFGQNPVLKSFRARTYYGARLEPVSQIVVGAGQANQASFDEFTQAVGKGNEPVIYMEYLGLKKENTVQKLRERCKIWNAYPFQVIPQIGLSMTKDGSPEERYEHEVAAGTYDKNIDDLVRELEAYNKPVYVRLGYEFNGHWNGYQPESFKQAWIRVTKAIRSKNLNVAMVWCFAPDGTDKDFMKFYPGDEWVDWWAIDLFSEKHFSEPASLAFMDSAMAHKKPVMIGECTPRRISVDLGQESWNRWFVPFFNFIRTYPHLKGFSYINWNWQSTAWPDWGNGRLQDNELVRKKFVDEISQPAYLKGLVK
jgi:hypothetical protein